jgi:PKD repeat protein
MNPDQTRASKICFGLILILVATVFIGFIPENLFAQKPISITINNGASFTNSTRLELTLSSSNATQMRLSEDNSSWSNWETFTTAKNYTLTAGDGNYTIYIQFLDSNNQTLIANSSIVLDTTSPEAIPYADWYTGDYRTVFFDASYSTDNIGIANYTWNFGDNNITKGLTVVHTYKDPGNYTVTLTVLDYAGNNAAVTFSARIPDLTSIVTPTPTPTPIVTISPTTFIPTANPTASSTPIASGFNTTWVTAIAAVLVIAVFGVIVILYVRKRSGIQTTV